MKERKVDIFEKVVARVRSQKWRKGIMEKKKEKKFINSEQVVDHI